MTPAQALQKLKAGSKLLIPGGQIVYDARYGVFKSKIHGEEFEISETYVWRLLKGFKTELVNPADPDSDLEDEEPLALWDLYSVSARDRRRRRKKH